jgi:circadian clock protein KaiC
MAPGEFAHIVRQAVDGTDGYAPATVVVIDSLNGYLHAMPEERFLALQIHELLTYLGHKGVVTFMTLAQHGLVGNMQSPIDTTYLADTVILFRYFEALGEVKRALSVVKKRTGQHEKTIREVRFDGGIRLGEPLVEFEGVLTGSPTFRGERGVLMGDRK